MKRLLLLIVLVVFSVGCVKDNASYSQACFPDGSCVKLELAVTQQERSRGLMHRESLDPDSGMLFIFPQEGIHTFWMKNTPIPLDILWLDADSRIAHLSENTPPCESDPCPHYTPTKEAKYVLEVNAHHTRKHGAADGARIILR